MKMLRVTGATVLLAVGLSACGGADVPQAPEPRTGEGALCSPDDGPCGGGGGGTPTVSASINTLYPGPEMPPAELTASVPLWPLDFGRPEDKCLQQSYAKVGFPSPLHQGALIFFTGVVAPGSRANFYFYNAKGNLVKTHLTNPSRDNCVINQEPETVSTADLPPGTYYVYSSFWLVGTHLISGWYYGLLAYPNRYVGSITVVP